MKVIADYHTHTVYSHGIGTIEENVVEAMKKGLETIAISDHGPGHLTFGIKKHKYIEMRNEIDRLNEKYTDIEVLLGLEANVMGLSGKVDIDDEMLAINDVLLCGYHFGSLPHSLGDLRIHFYNITKKMSKGIYKRAKKLNTIAVTNALRKYDIKILTHPGSKGPIDLEKVAQVAYEEGTLLEISNHHSKLSVEDLVLLKSSKVEFVVSSDAHKASDVGTFSIALKKIEDAGMDIGRVQNCREQ